MKFILLFAFCLTFFYSADLKGLEKISFDFELGKPFKPFEQLMGVLPVASMENVPIAYRVRVVDCIGIVGVDFIART